MNEQRPIYPRAYFRPGDFESRHSIYVVLTRKAVDCLIEGLRHIFDDQKGDVVCLAFPGDFLTRNDNPSADNDDLYEPIDGDVIKLMP